jgi:hypothetical protein
MFEIYLFLIYLRVNYTPLSWEIGMLKLHYISSPSYVKLYTPLLSYTKYTKYKIYKAEWGFPLFSFCLKKLQNIFKNYTDLLWKKFEFDSSHPAYIKTYISLFLIKVHFNIINLLMQILKPSFPSFYKLWNYKNKIQISDKLLNSIKNNYLLSLYSKIKKI